MWQYIKAKMFLDNVLVYCNARRTKTQNKKQAQQLSNARAYQRPHSSLFTKVDVIIIIINWVWWIRACHQKLTGVAPFLSKGGPMLLFFGGKYILYLNKAVSYWGPYWGLKIFFCTLIHPILVGVDAGPEESTEDVKPRLFPRDFSLFTSVIIFFILNVRLCQYHTQVIVKWVNRIWLAAWWCTRGWNKGRIVIMDNNSGWIWL